MRVYGMPHLEVMGLPMKVFWELSGVVPRLVADEQKSLLEILTASQNSEASTAMHEALNKLAPEPVVLSVAAKIAATSVRDEIGFAQLKAMSGAR